MQTVLVADDEIKIAALVESYLVASGYGVLVAHSGLEALALFKSGRPDCLILDINMPGLDGLSVAKEVRRSSELPIIFLSARAEEVDRILGLELGGDDYVTKPFSPRELVARVRAVLKRSLSPEPKGPGRLVRGGLDLDPLTRILLVDGRPVALTALQFDLLAVLMASPGRVWTRLELLEACAGSQGGAYERTIDAHVKNIRKALGDDSDHPRYIETLRGIGYRFMDQGCAP